MSEYQYYEFQAIDRPLTEKEMAEVRKLSTRAEVTSTSFTNEYHWGDFRGDPLDMMKRYYDAHLYFANWGTHRLMLRLPRQGLDVDAMRPYFAGECLDLHLTREHVIIVFEVNSEGADWDDVECSLAPLIPLREALLAGDLRPLYVGWLASLQNEYLDDETPEPPVPPGMGRLTGAIRALADFLWMDSELLGQAAEKSAAGAVTDVSEDDVAAWVAGQSAAAKDEWLRQVVRGEVDNLKAELWRQARRDRASKTPPLPTTSSGRTAAELLDALDERRESARRREAEKRQREREAAERKRAAERRKQLDSLAGREEELWRQVDQLVATSQPKNYDQAVDLLRDLRDLAARGGQEEALATRIHELRERSARKRSFIERLDKAGFLL